ncbi:exodeoxyribonuclease VII large subunit [Candidatus Uhrbacteria bacterium]|nr:exodeoxyribonuclease VII large subunit [Candidatus Uhrbacteria bacterium]
MAAPSQKIFTVSQFVTAVSAYLEQGLGMIAVQGEVVDYKVAKDRLVFFELKDKESRVSCFMMKWDLHMPLEDGMEVKVVGTPKLFQQSGKFHLRVMEVELVGAGALQRAFALLKEKLEKEGLFAPERKRALPRFPEHIGLVTSQDAAACTDVLRVLNNRWRGLQVTVAHVGVQGASAVPEIVGAIRWFNNQLSVVSCQLSKRPDVLIVTRGGGSLEDLQAFNSEDVARAIFSSAIPVVVGVGHERDVTLADFVADVRAATPSNAAELVVPDRTEVAWQVNSLAQSLEQRLQGVIGADRHRVVLSLQRLQDAVRQMMDAPRELIMRFAESFQNFRNTLATLHERVTRYTQLLHALSPEATLTRGYSITFARGKVIRSIRDVRVGDEVTTRVRDGSIPSVVRSKQSKLL